MPEGLDLRCPCCGLSSCLAAQAPSWVALQAYDAQWLDPDSALPVGDVWPRSDILPQPGSKRHVKVSYPFAAREGEWFWIMFVPGVASENGWVDDARAIPESGFVSSRLIEVAHQEKSWAWISITVNDVITMSEIEHRFPPATGSLPPPECHQTVNHTSFGDWEAIEASSEGDVGVWFLVRHSSQKVHLLAQGNWSFHEDSVWVGHAELAEDQWATFCDGMELR